MQTGVPPFEFAVLWCYTKCFALCGRLVTISANSALSVRKRLFYWLPVVLERQMSQLIGELVSLFGTLEQNI